MKQIVTLKNGLRVGNFSSPHDFKFDDGTILPAVSDEEAEQLKINFVERSDAHSSQQADKTYKVWWDVTLDFKLTGNVHQAISGWEEAYEKHEVDIVLIPLPMLTAMKNNNRYNSRISNMPFRCIRIEDRTNKLVSSEKFCI